MGRDPQSIEEFLPLHPEDLRILLVLRKRPLYGYAIVKELEAEPERVGRVLPGNLYRRVRTLLDQGLIAETEGPDDPDSDGRRRYFRISSRGEEVARAEAHRLESLLAEAQGLLRG